MQVLVFLVTSEDENMLKKDCFNLKMYLSRFTHYMKMFHWRQRSALVVLFYWSKQCSKIKEKCKLKTCYLHLTVSSFSPKVLKAILLPLSFQILKHSKIK